MTFVLGEDVGPVAVEALLDLGLGQPSFAGAESHEELRDLLPREIGQPFTGAPLLRRPAPLSRCIRADRLPALHVGSAQQSSRPAGEPRRGQCQVMSNTIDWAVHVTPASVATFSSMPQK